MQLRYSCGARQVVQDLPLPLAPHKFMVPEPRISKEMFFEKWKAYPGITAQPPVVGRSAADSYVVDRGMQ